MTCAKWPVRCRPAASPHTRRPAVVAGAHEPRQRVRAAARFALMGIPEHRRADHAPYVEEVCRCLESRDLDVTAVSITSRGGRREATLLIQAEQAAFGEPVAAEASVAWDEENGWSLTTRPDPVMPGAVAPVYKGLTVLPGPDDVAVWVVVLLTHPELTPSREDQSFRDHTAEDPQFERQLAEYAPGR